MTDDDTSDAVRWQRDVFPSCHLALRLYAFALNVMPWENGDTDTFVSWDALEDIMPYLSKIGEDKVELCTPVRHDGWKVYSTVDDVVEIRSVYTLVKSATLPYIPHRVHTCLHGGTFQKVIIEVHRHGEWIEPLLRRVRYMMFFHHNNIESLTDAFRRGDRLYIVHPHFDVTILSVIRTKKQTLSSAHAEYFMYQIMLGLAVLHSAGVTHGLLEPRYVDVRENCENVITRIGEIPGPLISQQTTYSAPERRLNKPYGPPCDIWSAGCVLVHLLMRTPFKTCESPEALRDALNSVVSHIPEEFANPHLGELLALMLVYEPSGRATADQLLAHPYFSRPGLRDPLDQTTSPLLFPAAVEGEDVPTAWEEILRKF